MSVLDKFLSEGLKNTILLRNNSGFSHAGSYVTAENNTLLDRWHLGDFSSVEYTISADYDSKNREILKCLVTASLDKSNLKIYSRCATNIDLVDVEARVNNSYVDVLIQPKTPKLSKTKVIFTAQYFQAQNPLVL